MSQNYSIDFICHTKHVNGDVVKPQSHTCYELVYYITGNGNTTLGDTEYKITPNTFSLISPHTLHSEHHYGDSDIIFLGFHGIAIPDISNGFYNDDNDVILNTLTDMVYEFNNHFNEYRKIMTLKLQELIVYISRFSAPSIKYKNDTIEFAIKYIEESYVSPINWRELAASCNYSYDYFHHLFKNVTGISPTQYLISCRLSAAKDMLLNSNYNCTEIAYRCGFSSSPQFSAQFKKSFGISPKQFCLKNKGRSSR